MKIKTDRKNEISVRVTQNGTRLGMEENLKVPNQNRHLFPLDCRHQNIQLME
jgi:hypothetical protein